MDNIIKLGVIGLGNRGYGLIVCELLKLPQFYKITAVCDVYSDRIDRAVNSVEEATGTKPYATDDYKELLKRDDVDAVLIASAWEKHIPIAIDALKAKKIVAMEVGGAYSVDDCFKLVRTQEETETPFMFLENCCYGERETMLIDMVKKGLFGKVVACSGAYAHDLREEITSGAENRHYRLRNYLSRNCENYPTHELGPLAQILNINRGNRMVSLVSMASASYGLEEYVKRTKAPDHPLQGKRFMQGDIVTTIIKCALGETITLELGTTLPRYYTRKPTVCGTKAYYSGDSDSLYLEDRFGDDVACCWIESNLGNARELSKEFNTETWKSFKLNPEGGHGGMDRLMLIDFAECVLQCKPFPIDVYDAASWMSISALSEESIAKGSMPVSIPDFTNGKWITRQENI